MGAPLLPPDEPGTDRYFGEIRPHIVMGWRPPEEVTEAPNGFRYRRRGPSAPLRRERGAGFATAGQTGG